MFGICSIYGRYRKIIRRIGDGYVKILLLSAKSFNKKKERADSLIVESAQIVTFVFCDETSIT